MSETKQAAVMIAFLSKPKAKTQKKPSWLNLKCGIAGAALAGATIETAAFVYVAGPVIAEASAAVASCAGLAVAASELGDGLTGGWFGAEFEAELPNAAQTNSLRIGRPLISGFANSMLKVFQTHVTADMLGESVSGWDFVPGVNMGRGVSSVRAHCTQGALWWRMSNGDRCMAASSAAYSTQYGSLLQSL